jgi:hypothetical protein
MPPHSTAPPMVSDHNSCSSPRTLPSSQMLPQPAGMRSQYETRCPSASVHVIDDSPHSYPDRSHESISELALKQRLDGASAALALWQKSTDLPKTQSLAVFLENHFH